MSTIEGVLIVYGKPVNGTIIAKQAAINMAHKAMLKGVITSYRFEEETEITGKVFARMETSGPLDKALQASTAFSEAMQSVQNLHPCNTLDLRQMEEDLLRLGEEQQHDH